jgi:hypothetical protein
MDVILAMKQKAELLEDYRKFWVKRTPNRKLLKGAGLMLKNFHFYLECQKYILSPESCIYVNKVKEVLDSDIGIKCRSIELISYSKIAGKLADCTGKKNRRDSSVRATLMEEGVLDRRWVSFTPGVSLCGLDNTWSEICCFMQAHFSGDNLPTDEYGNLAYYYYDSIKIVANYLHMLKSTASRTQIERQKRIVGMLNGCIPLGWRFQGANEFVVLCR